MRIAISTTFTACAGTHDALVEDRDIHEQLVQIDVLLIVHADQVVERVSGDREHRLLIALRVVEAVEQMNAPGPEVAQHTPMRPVYFAYPTAAKAAASSCRTWMNFSLS